MQLPFTKDDVIHGVLTDHALWHGTVKNLPDPDQLIVLVGLTNNPYSHPLVANGLKAKVDRFEIGLGVHAYVLQRGLEVFKEDERESRSIQQGSHALYLYKTRHNHHCTLFQVLPPFSVTSCHFHEYTTEDFFSLIGTCRVGTLDRHSDSGIRYQELAANRLIVQPHFAHQMANETDQFAINFLIMKRSDRSFTDATEMDDHHYVEPSPFKFKLYL